MVSFYQASPDEIVSDLDTVCGRILAVAPYSERRSEILILFIKNEKETESVIVFGQRQVILPWEHMIGYQALFDIKEGFFILEN